MGLATDFTLNGYRLTGHQYSDFKFDVEVLDVDGVRDPASNYINAEYLIADKTGSVIVRKSLGDGISVNGEYFKVFIDDLEMTFLGPCTHQFVVYATNGDKLPPIFKEPLKISPGLI